MINELYDAQNLLGIGQKCQKFAGWYGPGTWCAAEAFEQAMQDENGVEQSYVSNVHGYGSTLTLTVSPAGRVMTDFGAAFYDLMSQSCEYYATPRYEAWYFSDESDLTEKDIMQLLLNALEEAERPEEVIQIYPGWETELEGIKWVMIRHRFSDQENDWPASDE